MLTMLLVEALICALFLRANTVIGAENAFHIAITDDQRNIKHAQVSRKVGQPLSLNCSVTPSIKPSPTISWYKNDVVQSVANTNSDQWLVKNIHNTTLSDGGYYECKAKYQGEAKNVGIFVNMEGKPQLIDCCGRDLVTGNPMYIIASQPLTLQCYGTGWPDPTFQWLYNGVELKRDIGEESGKFKLQDVQNGLRLKLYGMMKQDEGKYTCDARNSYGTDTRTISVSVLGGGGDDDPEIRATQSHIQADVGQPNVTLVCIGERVRKFAAHTNWYYNGKELSPKNDSNQRLVFKARYYDQHTVPGVTPKVWMTLTIQNVTKDDHGNYTCEVSVLDKVVNTTIILAVGKNDSNKRRKDAKALKIQVIIPLVIGMVSFVFVIVAVFIFCRKTRKKVKRPKIPKGRFEYGAFITYSSQDYAWVKANLLPLLKDNDIEACIHYRNFDAGVLLEQNMVNCVYNSRVVIVIMSKSYMKSKYCRSELDYAIHRSVEEPDSNSLITLRIDDSIKENNLPRAIRNKTFLDVASDIERDTWKHRLLMHVKCTATDLNRNVADDEKSVNSENIGAEQESLLDPCQDNIA